MIKECYYVTLWCCLLMVCCGHSPSSCLLKETCAACIRVLDCVWCALPINGSPTGDSLIRCVNVTHQLSGWCPEEYIVNPKSHFDILEDKELTSGTDKEEAVQIRPQRIQLSLRQGEQKEIHLQYQQAMTYPIDLYYLMDLSASMEDDRDILSALGNELATVMKNITKNFRLGFGSFVDKPEMPYTDTVPEKLKEPSIIFRRPIASPYGFKHQVSLTTDTNLFSREVKNAPVSQNVDYPEGGLDALMQVMVCTDEIGWRQKARKLIIFSSDAGFHMAGDGKLAGIVEPNDGQCHLDKSGLYSYSLHTDYPSIAQIDSKARENNINIIFAIAQDRANLYQRTKNNIYGASYGALTQDSSNIVDLIKAEYEKLVDSITLADNSSDSVEIQYFSNCLETEVEQKNKCTGLLSRPIVNFTATIKALSCPADREKWNQIIQIRPGSLNETLSIELEILCECPCEKQGHSGFKPHSENCNRNGSLQCGVCSCDYGRYGRFCQCSGDEAKTFLGDIKHCHSENNTEIICSGQGSCKCGKCDCFKRSNAEEVVYGTHCECDNFSCKRNGGSLCSGPDKGRCDCGQCICQSGWSGPACECKETNIPCMAPGSEEVCSGHGNCVCGACQCSLTKSFRYSGRYCEECPNCSDTRCDELHQCVECQVFGTGIYDVSECEMKCTAFQSEVIDSIKHTEDNTDTTERVCFVSDSTDCIISFKYSYEDDNVSLKVQAVKTKNCCVKIDLWAVIFGVISSILLAGLVLLIIWKVLAVLHDRREFTKFENERKTAKWNRGDNPLYKTCMTTFKNPIFPKDM